MTEAPADAQTGSVHLVARSWTVFGKLRPGRLRGGPFSSGTVLATSGHRQGDLLPAAWRCLCPPPAGNFQEVNDGQALVPRRPHGVHQQWAEHSGDNALAHIPSLSQLTARGTSPHERVSVHPGMLAADPGDGRLDDPVREGPYDVREQVQYALEEGIPRLRGRLHAMTAPLSVVAGAILVALSPTPAIRIGSGIFALSAVILFTASATLHRGGWSARVNAILTRLDHSSIFLLIAGSYTPFTLLLLHGSARATLLWVAWGGAAAGIGFRVLWSTAPRWIYTPIYVALGWAAVVFAGDFVRNGTPGVILLLALGGVLYTIGAVVYGVRRPNPYPAWFGFHEVFHALTIAAFAAHYTGISIATYALR